MSCLISDMYNIHSLNAIEFETLLEQLEKIVIDKYGYAKGIISAQVKLETGSGKKIIDHNLFNIKATGNWVKSGNYTEVLTTEYQKGTPVKIIQKFRKYNTYAESLKDYINLISSLERYKVAWNNRKYANGYFNGLVTGGYATDPVYAEKLNRIYTLLA